MTDQLFRIKTSHGSSFIFHYEFPIGLRPRLFIGHGIKLCFSWRKVLTVFTLWKEEFFFDVPSPFRTHTMMSLHNFQAFVVLSNFLSFTSPLCYHSTFYSHKLIKQKDWKTWERLPTYLDWKSAFETYLGF